MFMPTSVAAYAIDQYHLPLTVTVTCEWPWSSTFDHISAL